MCDTAKQLDRRNRIAARVKYGLMTYADALIEYIAGIKKAPALQGLVNG